MPTRVNTFGTVRKAQPQIIGWGRRKLVGFALVIATSFWGLGFVASCPLYDCRVDSQVETLNDYRELASDPNVSEADRVRALRSIMAIAETSVAHAVGCSGSMGSETDATISAHLSRIRGLLKKE